MAVPDWPPTRIMKKFFDEQYKPKSGNTVKLDVDFIPWPDFYTRVNASLTSGEQKYNFIVSDSQWLGAFVEGGYYRKINDLLDADPDFKATLDGMHPALAARPTRPIPTSRDELLRLPAVPGRSGDLRPQGRALPRGRAEELPGEVQREAALHGRRNRRHGLGHVREGRRVLPAQEGRHARRPACSRTISTASPTRPARATTSRRCRSTASSGRWRQHLGRNPGPDRPGRRRRELAGTPSRRSSST